MYAYKYPFDLATIYWQSHRQPRYNATPFLANYGR